MKKQPDKFDCLGRQVAWRVFEILSWDKSKTLTPGKDVFARAFGKMLLEGKCVMITRLCNGNCTMEPVKRKDPLS